jgi:hypothetical protein
MFHYLPSPAAKEIPDIVSSLSPCIIMKDDEVRCQQVSSLSPECWTKMMILAKMKEPLRGTRYITREIIHAVGRSLLDIK